MRRRARDRVESTAPPPADYARLRRRPARRPGSRTTFGLDEEPGTGRLRPRAAPRRSTAPTAPRRSSPSSPGVDAETLRARRSATRCCAGYRARRTRRPASRCSRSGCTSSSAGRHRLRDARARGRHATSPTQGQQFVPGDREQRAPAAGVLPRVRPGVLHRRSAQRRRPAGASYAPRRADTTPATTTSDDRVPLRQHRRALAGRLDDELLERAARRLARGARPTGGRGQARLPARTCRRSGPRRSSTGASRRRRAARATACPRRSGSACAAASPTAAAQPATSASWRRSAPEGRERGDDDPRPRPRSAACATTRRSSPRRASCSRFTDNRQDASLQAGHFNDFVEVGLLRVGAVPGGRRRRARTGSTTTSSPPEVFEALGLPIERLRASTRRSGSARAARDRRAPCATCSATASTATSSAAGGSPRRTWSSAACSRSTTQSLDELCAAEDVWEAAHPALATRHPRAPRARRDGAARLHAARARDRRRLPRPDWQEAAEAALAASASSRRGRSTRTSSSSYARGRSTRGRAGGHRDDRGNVYVSARGGFGQFLAPADDVRRHGQALDARRHASTSSATCSRRSRVAGLVDGRRRAVGRGRRARLPARRPRRCAGARATGRRAFHDPIRVPSAPDEGAGPTRSSSTSTATSPATAGDRGAGAHRPGAAEERQEREEEFRDGRAAVLFCSPTMELGVDIAELNVVNMRNVPPTPANYAQRSGRAGRSGQPALVFTYCAAGSPHDQYFFRRPERMVAGPGQAAAARPRQRGPRPRARPRDLARRDGDESSARRSPTSSTLERRSATSRAARTRSRRASTPDVAHGAGRAAQPAPRDDLGARRGRLVHDRLARRRSSQGAPHRVRRRLRPLARAVPRGARRCARRQHKIIGDDSRGRRRSAIAQAAAFATRPRRSSSS